MEKYGSATELKPDRVLVFSSPTCEHSQTYNEIVGQLDRPDLQIVEAEIVDDTSKDAIELAISIGVQATPTTVMYRGGELVGGFAGKVTLDVLNERLKEVYG